MNAIVDDKTHKTRVRLEKTYRWEIPDRPPLLLGCSSRPTNGRSFLDLVSHPEIILAEQIAAAEKARYIGSDHIPRILPVPLNAALVPSMYGSKQKYRDDHVWTEPLAAPFAQIVRNLELPTLNDGLFPTFERCVRYCVQNAPEWAHVCCPSPHAALESASMLIGIDKMVFGMMDEPAAMQTLLEALAETHIQATLRMKELVGEPPDRCVAHPGVYMPATRIANDTIVNLSPALIRQFFNPHMQSFAQGIGSEVCMHWCAIPSHPGQHVLSAIAECTAITGIATHPPALGLSTRDPVALQRALDGRFALSIGIALPKTTREFQAWTEELASRWARPTGIILRSSVSSAEQGHKYMSIWREIWGES